MNTYWIRALRLRWLMLMLASVFVAVAVVYGQINGGGQDQEEGLAQLGMWITFAVFMAMYTLTFNLTNVYNTYHHWLMHSRRTADADRVKKMPLPVVKASIRVFGVLTILSLIALMVQANILITLLMAVVYGALGYAFSCPKEKSLTMNYMGGVAVFVLFGMGPVMFLSLLGGIDITSLIVLLSVSMGILAYDVYLMGNLGKKDELEVVKRRDLTTVLHFDSVVTLHKWLGLVAMVCAVQVLLSDFVAITIIPGVAYLVLHFTFAGMLMPTKWIRQRVAKYTAVAAISFGILLAVGIIFSTILGGRPIPRADAPWFAIPQLNS